MNKMKVRGGERDFISKRATCGYDELVVLTQTMMERSRPACRFIMTKR